MRVRKSRRSPETAKSGDDGGTETSGNENLCRCIPMTPKAKSELRVHHCELMTLRQSRNQQALKSSTSPVILTSNSFNNAFTNTATTLRRESNPPCSFPRFRVRYPSITPPHFSPSYSLHLRNRSSRPLLPPRDSPTTVLLSAHQCHPHPATSGL